MLPRRAIVAGLASTLVAPLLGAALATTGAPASATTPAHADLARSARAAAAAGRPRHVAPRPAAKRATPTPHNPLAGLRMGVYQGAGEQSWAPYVRSRGVNRSLLAEIALRPKSKWFGSWISEGQITAKVRAYVANATGGRPDVLAQLAVFRMTPWEHEACRRLPTAREQAAYRRWIDNFAAGIGSAHVALVLQPDGPFALCAPKHSRIPSQLIAYSAQRFSALPHTSVYIDGGAADWPAGNVGQAVGFLIADGIRYARGVALNSTHYSATGDEVGRGTAIVDELARRGIGDKHVVVNTSSNGKPFTFNKARGKDPDNASVCRSRTDRGCVTLGIPPTTDVANARWGLSTTQRQQARRTVDAYLWFGRPWLYRQADPFDLKRALALVRTSPY